MNLINQKFSQIRIENTNICNYKCAICPREKMTRKKGIMSVDDFQYVINLFDDFDGFLNLHGYGEPLLDPNFIQKATLAHIRQPRSKIVFYTTLGLNLSENFFDTLSQTNVRQIYISFYGFSKEEYQLIHGVDNFDLVCKNLKLLSAARKKNQKEFDIFLVIPSDKMQSKLKLKQSNFEFLNWIESLGISYGEMKLHNYGNGRGYLKPEETLCAVISSVRKSILQITWDMNVIPCCYDFNSDIVFGNLKDQSLEEIFTSKIYENFVIAHLHNDYKNYSICKNCQKN